MPFTLAHPAAAVPLRRLLGRFGIVSALAIPSMTPDFCYWLPYAPLRSATHSLAATVWFCIPVGLGLYCLFHMLLWRPLLALMPAAIVLRVKTQRRFAWRDHNWGGVCVSLFVGALTHVAWDSFTHSGGAAVEAFPSLRDPLLSWHGHTLRVYKALQHGGTLAGFAVIAMCVEWWMRATPVRQSRSDELLTRGQKAAVLAGIAVPALLVGTVLGLREGPPEVDFGYVRAFARASVVPGMGVGLACLVAMGIAWSLIERRRFRDRQMCACISGVTTSDVPGDGRPSGTVRTPRH